MCGFIGIFGGISDEYVFVAERMLDLVEHRGPDAKRTKSYRKAILAHARLKIQDLSEKSNQPFLSPNGAFELLFNGEIYNFIEIRNKLRTHYDFTTESDTEVLCAAWQHWGEGCLQYLKGMFAFCVYDTKNNKVTLVRDRFGQKPLFYSRTDSCLVIASEIKPILAFGITARPNDNVWARYLLKASYDDTEETYFDAVNQLLPGEIITFFENNLVSRRYYYQLADQCLHNNLRLDEATHKVRETMVSVCDMHMRSDVPVGLMLSGGLDSSSMLAALNIKNHTKEKLKSFSVDFGEMFSERVWIEEAATAFNVASEIVSFSPNDFFESIKPMMWHLEGPIGGLMNCALRGVMEAAQASGVQVLLDGTGPDEAFGGYQNHHNLFIASLLTSGDKNVQEHIKNYSNIWGVSDASVERIALRELALLTSNTAIDGTIPVQSDCLSFDENDLSIAPQNYIRPANDLVKDALIKYVSGSKILRNNRFLDRISMAYGIELRLPFLEHEFVELGLGLPNSMYFLDGYTKGIIRWAFDGFMPDSVRLAKKRSIQAPQGEWLRLFPMRDYIWDMLHSTPFASRGYFNIPECKRKFQDFLDGKFENSFFVWQWINVEEWHLTFKDENSTLNRHYLDNNRKAQ
jgi:asparagine synthase (glutamine-hydrolysing)